MRKYLTSNFALVLAFLLGIPLTLSAQSNIPDPKQSVTQRSDSSSAGIVYNIPYGDNYDFADDINNNYTIIDANGDGNSWAFASNMWKGYDSNYNLIPSGTVQYTYSHDGAEADDWLVSPLLNLKSDRDYNLYVRTGGTDHSHDFDKSSDVKIFIGTGDDPTTYTNQVVLNGGSEGGNDFFSSFNGLFSVPSEGQYRFAIHVTGSDANYLKGIGIDTLGITENCYFNAPAKVNDFKVTAGPKGERSATISFNAPTENYKGDALNEITNIYILNGNNIIKTFNNPSPGEALSFTESSVDYGMATFSAYAENNIGKGLTVTDSAYIGTDIPIAPQNAKATDHGDHLTISWDPVTTGIHNGYIDVDNVTYTITNSFGMPVSSNTKQTSIDVIPNGLTGAQHTIYYNITANVGDFTSEKASTYPTVLGDPYQLPFHESFANGSEENEGWWTYSNVNFYNFAPTNTQSSDGDNGCAYLSGYNYYHTTEGLIGWLNTGKLSLSGTTNPGLVFSYSGYSYQATMPSRLVVLIDNGGQSIDTVAVDTFGVDTVAWHRAVIPLSKYKDSPYIVIRFGGIITDTYGAALFVDDVNVRDMLKDNLQVKLETDSIVTLGRQENALVTVYNIGLDEASADSYNIHLFVDGKDVNTISGADLKANERGKYNITYVPSVNSGNTIDVKAVVEYLPDLDTNDNTASVSIKTKTSPLPKVTDLNGSTDGTIATIAWNAPDLSNIGPTTEGFEDYTPWTNQFGDWRTIDGDGANTSYDGRISTPVDGDPNSYFIFNPSLADENYSESAPEFTPYDGNQYLASFSADDRSSVRNDDDWLISPELSGRAQTISFWAKSLSHETFEVYSSKTNNDRNSFTESLTSRAVTPTSDWQQYSYDIPEGTKYFAIHHNTRIRGNELALFLDDITYEGFYDYLVLTGYNVYRNGEFIANVKDVTSFTDTNASKADTYQVSAVYNAGESLPSDPISIEPTGINSIKGGLHIAVAHETIIIDGANNEDSEIYSIDGSLICKHSGADNYTINVKKGTYIVKVGNHVTKVIVK